MLGDANYRADVDGLRAVAVLGVLLYHFGSTWLPGGFTGVDVFFVISGYVITGKISREMAAGTFTVLGFYDSRVRRIFPAALVVITASLAAGFFLLWPGDYASLGMSAAYAAAGLGNLFFFLSTGYFDQEAELQPLLHFWSLGVEEQFYVVWPVTLWALMHFTARLGKSILPVLAALAVAGFALAQFQMSVDPKAAFYLPHLRAWELLLGAVLVFIPAVGSRLPSATLSIAGAGLVAYSYLHLSAEDPFPGLNAAYACIGSALLIAGKSPTFVAAALSLRPIVFVGRISYSMYLWHWPVLVFFRHYNNGAMPSALEGAFLAALTFVLSVLSWRYVEQPFRRPARSRRKVVAAGVAAAAVTAILGLTVNGAGGFVRRLPPELLEMQSLDEMWKWNCTASVALPGWGNACQFGAHWDATATKAVLWGDSHAEHMAPLFESVAGSTAFLLARTCPALVGNQFKVQRDDQPSYSDECGLYNRLAERLFNDRPEINLIIFAASWSSLLNVLHADGEVAGDRQRAAELLEQGMRDLIRRLSIPGRRFILVTDVPWFKGSYLCRPELETMIVRRSCGESEFGSELSQFTLEQGAPIAAFRHIAAEFADVSVIPVGEAMCASGRCMTELDGVFLYRDGGHLRRNLPSHTKTAIAEMFGFDTFGIATD